MADLKQFSKNFRKDLGDVDQAAQKPSPGMFDQLMALIPSPQPEVVPQPTPVATPTVPLDQSAANFFQKMRK